MVKARKDASKRMEQGQRKERVGCLTEKTVELRGLRRALHALRYTALAGFKEGFPNLFSRFVGLGASGNITAEIELS
jgi:hypothetical protein